MAGQEESQSTPALIHIPGGGAHCSGAGPSTSTGGGCAMTPPPLHGAIESMAVPENSLRESCTRLSISLEENGLYKVSLIL